MFDRCLRAVLEDDRWASPCMIFHSIYGHSCAGTEGLNVRPGQGSLCSVKNVDIRGMNTSLNVSRR